LADDLMEPFRPAVDILVRELREEDVTELAPPIKRRLAGVLHVDYACRTTITLREQRQSR